MPMMPKTVAGMIEMPIERTAFSVWWKTRPPKKTPRMMEKNMMSGHRDMDVVDTKKPLGCRVRSGFGVRWLNVQAVQMLQ